MHKESHQNINEVAKGVSAEQICSVIHTKPTKTLAPMPTPAVNVRNNVNFRLVTASIIITDIICMAFPMTNTFFLPKISLSLGMMKLPITTPMNQEVPKTPKSFLGEHYMSKR